MAEWTRLELATSCVTGRRSNQLNYHSVFNLKIKVTNTTLLNNYYIIFISISTHDGKESVFNTSIVWGVDWLISISLLCVLNSNCSLASLLTKVDLLTVITFLFTGIGIGQDIIAQDRSVASIIFAAALLIKWWSNDLIMILTFQVTIFLAIVSMFLRGY